MKFKLKSNFKSAGDQPAAIRQLVQGIKKKYKQQTLLGVTGSGKTFTMAKVIEKIQKPTLIIAPNKTLAAQLAAEFKDLFPDNAVHYFVSDYDYYQPEAYLPRTDTYISKDASINEEITKLRHAATQALITRQDTIIVASVSCIYSLGSPEEYRENSIFVQKDKKLSQTELLNKLIAVQYKRNDLNFTRGTVRVRGEAVEVFPTYGDQVYRMEFFGDKIEKIKIVDYLTGDLLNNIDSTLMIYPADLFITRKEKITKAVTLIKKDLKKQLQKLKKADKLVEAQRLEQRTMYDIEMLEATGHISGIENYVRYLNDLKPGESSTTLLDYFPKDFLMFVDESHITLSQIKGMYQGDKSRKTTLVEHGFRLPSVMDNRPLTVDEFNQHIKQVIYVSATPDKYELDVSKQIVEQIVRPTGLIDPLTEIRSTKNQIDDLLNEINKRVKKKQRVLITTLTKKMSEELSNLLAEKGIKVQYLHSEVKTLDRIKILESLRLGEYDVLVGINLLREGLDLPEVSLVIILDADKQGFLRSKTALIQTFGRASRHIEGRVIMYADKVTDAMKGAVAESDRRREKQVEYNKKHKITPQTIVKKISSLEVAQKKKDNKEESKQQQRLKRFTKSASKNEIKYLIEDLENQMDLATKSLDFERAAELRDEIDFIKDTL